MKSLERTKPMRQRRKEDAHHYEKLLNKICAAFKIGWISEETDIPGLVVISLVPMHPYDLLGGSCRLERQDENGSLESTSYFFGTTLEGAFKEAVNEFVWNDVLRCLPKESSKKDPGLVSRSEDIHMLDNLDKIEIQLDLLGA